MKTDPKWYRPTMQLRGITRRESNENATWVTWAIQQWWEGPAQGEGEWRDIPKVNEWDLPADDAPRP